MTVPNALCQIKQIALKDIRLEGNVSNFIFKGGVVGGKGQIKIEQV